VTEAIEVLLQRIERLEAELHMLRGHQHDGHDPVRALVDTAGG
jgi:hypothetical protein